MNLSTELDALRPLVSHMEDYFGVWAMHERRFRALVDQVNSMNLSLHVQERQAQTNDGPTVISSSGYPIRDGIATFELAGTLMKRTSSLTAGTSTIRTRQQLRAARQDPLVSGAMLVVDSPGGTVAGTDDLATEVARFAEEKPIFAFIEDLGASAAYYPAAQASRIYANRSAQVGSIGTFAVAVDASKLAENEGLVVHVIRSGPFKGAGIPGSAITDEMLAEWQAEVDEFASQFIDAVATGRGLDRRAVEAAADGRVFFVDEAERLGLIDGVRRYDAAVAELRREISGTNTQRRTEQMNEVTNDTPKAATYAEIVAACKGADSGFICACLEKGLTVDAARDDYVAALAERVQTAEEKATAAEEKAATAVRPVGVEPATATETIDDPPLDVRDQFDGHVRDLMKRDGLGRREAIKAVSRAHPDLHKAYLIETNPGKKQRRMIEEKFDEQ